MNLARLLIALAMTVSAVAHAQEHPACSNLDYHHDTLSSQALRSIAASCKSAAVASLYYNRAYHADLVAEATALAGLIAYSPNGQEAHFEAYRLYIALIEQMAPVWHPDSKARVDFLNREYDRRGEIAGLRLRGYDRVADRLERDVVTR